MDTLALTRDREFNQLAEVAVRQYCKEVHEITYIEHGADNLVILANREFVFRFPRNEAASARLYFETALLQKIAHRITAIPIPQVVHINHHPLFVVAQYLEGVHLSGEQVQALSTDEQDAIGTAIGRFMAELNQNISGADVKRLRIEAKVDHLEEPWAPYFQRLFESGNLPNEKLRPVVDEFYPLWKDFVTHEQATFAIHDDLHPVNLLFMGPVLSGILDFGDANMGSIEEELRWLYVMGDIVLRAAIAEYQRLTGNAVGYDHIRVWAIMHELSSYTDRLAKGDTESFPFQRAQTNLRAWVSNFPL
ncbi:MAG TPA: aminoglycoside phosphotransferase family protein [Candidatus Saccharimonadales bacterium]|nr:aminoglycoside phosphotransferase family protein [Candidatus Saccharimonadales bacterium]